MRIDELKARLDEEGCSPMNYAIGARSSDAICLMQDGDLWQVFYSERGCDSPPMFSSGSESEACDFFLACMRKEAHWHLVGTFDSEPEAKAFEREVSRLGANPVRNDLPASILGSPKFRVFVIGRDIHLVKSIQR